MSDITKVIGAILAALLFAAVIAALFAFPTKWLWNWLMPDLFALKRIDAWQALGLNVLCGLLFKSSSTSSNK